METPNPPPVGTELLIEFDFAGLTIETSARVIYAIGREEAKGFVLGCGLGCVFTGLDAELEGALRARVAKAVGRHRLPGLEEAGSGAELPGAA